MNSEPREKIGGLFSNPKFSVLPEKCIFTDFNKDFPHEFIGVSDNESNPPRQPYIKKMFSYTYKERFSKMR